MDPVTAIANAVTALAQVYLAVLNATPEADKAKVADWIVQDTAKVRAFFRMGS